MRVAQQLVKGYGLTEADITNASVSVGWVMLSSVALMLILLVGQFVSACKQGIVKRVFSTCLTLIVFATIITLMARFEAREVVLLLLAFYYTAAAIARWGLVIFGIGNQAVRFFHQVTPLWLRF